MKTVPKKKDRVRVKSLDIKGSVAYVHHEQIAEHHFYPVQVQLDKPYDESGQTMYRTCLPDLVKLKKKVNA